MLFFSALLSNKALRDRYWAYYYDKKPSKFQTAELERMTQVTKRLKSLSKEEAKHEYNLELLDLENTRNTFSPSAPSSPSCFTAIIRRSRSSHESLDENDKDEFLNELAKFRPTFQTLQLK
ncbi:unnamed protein product [Didymodactylos carnosus]|uniref:Uncharacterized protein n=1 Tax=Didymodactylos carnosus TaxID=1234261 RepID=A0A816BZ78_9BILA|nr:unnamed protein product [Didymodactylos carnosus]CAF4501190.1 unnamed protein product [Didymodactylos carnosus]